MPDQTRRALEARAAARGESLNLYLLDVIEREVARPTVKEVLDRAVIAVDCAAVVDALTAVEGTDDLRALLASEELCALTLLDFEVVSALRGMTLRGELLASRAEDPLTDLDDLEIRRWPFHAILRRRASAREHRSVVGWQLMRISSHPPRNVVNRCLETRADLRTRRSSNTSSEKTSNCVVSAISPSRSRTSGRVTTHSPR